MDALDSANLVGLSQNDPDLDKAIRSLLQETFDSAPAAHFSPLSWIEPSAIGQGLDTNLFVNDDGAAFHNNEVGAQKVPVLWSMDGNSGMASYGASQALGADYSIPTPAHAESLKGDMGKCLGHLPTPDFGAPPMFEDFMDFSDLAKESATPQLSPTSPASTTAPSPLEPMDRLSHYHRMVAAGHARHLTQLVEPAPLHALGHPTTRSLASSLSYAVLPSSPVGRPDPATISANKGTGLTIQQRRRMTLLAQRSTTGPTRKRQLSAPGSCLPGFAKSPEVAQAHPRAAASPKEAALGVQQDSCIPCTQDPQDNWSDVVLANSHDLVFVLSLKGTVLYITPSVERILGFLQEEVVGRALVDFCHPADIGPFCRELKESTALPPGDEDRVGCDDSDARSFPKINLIMRLNVKSGGYRLIEATGSLSIDPPKHRKVVVCSGRPQPIPMLPWDHVRGDLREAKPSAWLKLSHNGIFLGCTGPINQILGIEDVNLVGRHIRDLPMVASSTELLEALRSGRTIMVQDWIQGSSEQRSPVKLTVYPWTSDGRSSTVAFVHVQQGLARSVATDSIPMKRKAPSSDEANPSDSGAGGLTGSFATANGKTARCMSRCDAISTVFSELTSYHNGSWLVEMQKLQNANKRLRHELQALTATKRPSGSTGLDA
ncbi:hypothetical protein ACQY0O_000150 [Thecaphora frezii]